MRKLIFLLSCLLLFPSFSFASPAINFRSLSHDAGTVSQENKVVHVFDFINKGDQELIIQKVSAS